MYRDRATGSVHFTLGGPVSNIRAICQWQTRPSSLMHSPCTRYTPLSCARLAKYVCHHQLRAHTHCDPTARWHASHSLSLIARLSQSRTLTRSLSLTHCHDQTSTPHGACHVLIAAQSRYGRYSRPLLASVRFVNSLEPRLRSSSPLRMSSLPRGVRRVPRAFVVAEPLVRHAPCAMWH